LQVEDNDMLRAAHREVLVLRIEHHVDSFAEALPVEIFGLYLSDLFEKD
jgi:hypothetical protein